MEIGDLTIGYYSDGAISGNTPIEIKGNLYFAIKKDIVLHLATINKNDEIVPMMSDFSYEIDSLKHKKIEKVDYSFIPKIKRQLVLRRLFGGK